MSDTVESRERCIQLLSDAVMKDRAREYGNPEDSFNEISRLWSWYLGKDVSALDVSIMMILLKMARCKCNPAHLDNFVDIAGYAVCGYGITDRLESSDKD